MKSFTLIETLVAIVVFTIIMVAISTLIVVAYRTQNYTWQQSIAINEARRGIETMVREIREARTGDNGAYPIEKAGDKEFIFYSDIDKDGAIERVRYFLGTENPGNQALQCVTFSYSGSCSVIFSDFLQGTLISAEVKVSVEGDFNMNNREYAEIFADGIKIGEVCRTGCGDCVGYWQGTAIFDVTDQASDGFIEFLADGTNDVGPQGACDWLYPNHAMNAKFEFSWTEEITVGEAEFKKGVINPSGSPVQYLLSQEEVSVLSSYVRNSPPIFEYYDANSEKIEVYPSRLADTKVMKLLLIIDVDENRLPPPFELSSAVQLRNLKEE